MKIMPVVFELNEDDKIELKNKMLIYKLFSNVCQENNILFMTKIEQEQAEGYLVFDKENSNVVRKITRKVNEILSDSNIEYAACLPMIMDGVAFKVPTFYPDGKIKIMR